MFYRLENRILSVTVGAGDPPALSAPQVIVARPPDDRDYRLSYYMIAPDGQHVALLQESAPSSLILMSDWRARLRR